MDAIFVPPGVGIGGGSVIGGGSAIGLGPIFAGIGAIFYPSPVGEGSDIVPPYESRNKDTRKVIDGLQDQIDKHKEKIKNCPNGPDVAHWEHEIRVWEERIERLKRRLP